MKENTNEEKYYTVYMHTSPSGKRYIGITKRKPEDRWKNGYGYRKNVHFWNAISFYNWHNFQHDILYTNLTKEEAEQKEIELIAYYKSNKNDFGYNIASGGNCIGTISEDTKKKLSIAHTGKKLSPEHIEKIRESSKNRYTEELKIKLAEHLIKSVCQYDRDGNFIKKYDSVTEAAKSLGIIATLISACCGDKRKTAGNFIWRYQGEELTKEHIAWCNDNRNYGHMIPVCQYDLNGRLLNTYISQINAEKETGINNTVINGCCNKIYKTAGGFIWRRKGDLLTEEDIKWCNEKASDKNKKAVIQYDLSGNFIKIFKSAIDVKQELGIDNSEIGKCCKGNRKHVGGFIWRYASDIEDPTASLFGSLSEAV